MPGKERSIFQMIVRDFLASLKINRSKLIGEDYYGTKYYEIPPRKRSTIGRPSRYFEPVNKDNFEQEIPAEWEAWLRHRRKEPPTKEEVEKNYQMQLIKKQNAKLLEEKYSCSEREDKKLVNQDVQQSSFPSYEEYKNRGEDYKIKISKDK